MERHERIEAIYNTAALLGTEEERKEYVARACGKDDDLRSEIESLLAAHDDSRSETEFEILETVEDPSKGDDGPGTVIGPYKLLQRIGEGGFGTVYMAEQQTPLVRKVALKIIKLGMDTRQVIARFEAERQALAMMDHPNIARVLDAGATETGRPYFVMELVRGIPITQFCDEEQLTMQERLDLFVEVCQAVQHAHQKGIIHRDIKPSNVLVTMHDDRAVPKVIDFGIAKATQGRLTEKTLFTQFQQFIGTPVYMSPEQAQMSGLDIDTRSDIYSLGVLLYELLTGKTPFDARELVGAGYDEIRRWIREEEPPKPSTRLSTLAADERDPIARRRRLEPGRLGYSLRGDLDWIVMKALEKDRQRRYESASGLALDVRNYLADEPVSAVAPGPWYRLGKFYKRNRIACITAAAFVGMIATSAIVASVLAIRLNHSNQVALKAEQEANVQRDLARRHAYAADVRLAQETLKVNLTGATRNLLDTHVPSEGAEDLRGFEWYYFQELARSDESYSLPTQEKWFINQIEFIGNDLLVSEGKSVTVWDLTSKQALHTFRETAGYFSHGFAIKDRLLALVDRGENQAVLYSLKNPARPEVVNRFPLWVQGEHRGLYGVAFSPTRSHLAIGSGKWEGGSVTIWDYENREILATLDEAGFLSTFSPGGDRILTNGGYLGPPIALWDASQYTKVREFLRDPNHGLFRYRWRFTALEFFPDGSRIAACINDSLVWNTDRGEAIGSLRGGSRFEGHESLAFSPDGTRIATAGWDQSIGLWDARSLERTGELRGHSDQVLCVAFSQDGQALASGGKDGAIKVWPVTPRSRSDRIIENVHGLPVWSPDGMKIAAATGPDQVTIWENLEIRTRIQSRNGSIGFSPDALRLIAAPRKEFHDWETEDHSTELEIYDLESPGEPALQERINLDGFASEANQLKKAYGLIYDPRREVQYFGLVSDPPDGREASRVTLWSAETGKVICNLPPGGQDERSQIFFVAVSPTEPLIATAEHFPPRVKLWDLNSGALVRELIGHVDGVTHCVFFSDGKRLASSGLAATIRIWDLDSGEQIGPTMRGHQLNSNLSISPDGKTLASGASGWDSFLKLYNVGIGREVASFMDEGATYLYPSFSPDGKTLAIWAEETQQVRIMQRPR